MSERAILYLESDEEIPTIIDRIKEEKSDAITLVIPKASIVLQSVINLKLLARVSKEVKKTIAIVSHDPIGRNLAAQVGIPAYDSINAKMPVLGATTQRPDTDDIIELDLSAPKTPPVNVHHFQDSSQSEPISEPASFTAKPVKAETPAPRTVTMPSMSPPASPAKIGPRKTKKHGLLWALLVALVVIALGGVVFYPKATVNLTVKGEPFEGEVTITAAKDQKEADLVAARIPASSFEVIKEKTEKIDATGKKNVGEKAKGSVTFSNSYSTDSQKIAAGTKLTKEGKAFVTLADVTIPGAVLTLTNGQITANPGKATGNIAAAEAGEEFNVSAGKFAIADYTGDKRDKIYAESTNSLSGGSSKEITVVSASDIEKAKDTVKESLESDAKKELQDQAKGLVLLDKAIQANILEATPSVAEGTEAANFDLHVKARAQALAFSDSSFRDSFLANINQKIEKDKELLLGNTDEIVTVVESADFTKQELEVKGTIKSKLGPKFDREGLKADITGKSVSQAQATSKAIPGVEEATVSVKPNWLFGHLPFSSKQVEVKVDYQ